MWRGDVPGPGDTKPWGACVEACVHVFMCVQVFMCVHRHVFMLVHAWYLVWHLNMPRLLAAPAGDSRHLRLPWP